MSVLFRVSALSRLMQKKISELFIRTNTNVHNKWVPVKRGTTDCIISSQNNLFVPGEMIMATGDLKLYLSPGRYIYGVALNIKKFYKDYRVVNC